jgi:hypothetical protein
VNFYVYGKVGTVTIDDFLIVVGASYVGIITPVCYGMNTIDVKWTLVGTSVIGTITGLGGKVGTTINYVVGTLFGI